jgi:hypothetical protein
MQYSRETVNELNALSKEVFGTTSKWKKMIDMGVTEPVMEDTKRLTLKDGKEEYETVKTQKTHIGPNGAELPLFNLHHYDVDSVKEFMLGILVQRIQIRQAIERAKEEKAKETLRQQITEQASGTAV